MENDSILWAEKYRPKKISDLINQKHVSERVKAFVKDKNIPHMLFAGPPGCGKTTLALAIAHELYKDQWKSNVLSLNASDERGIDVIRGQVKDFARILSIGEVPFKLIILDEADALTQEAQQALRRTMENFASVTRFILICVSPDTKILLPNEIEISMDEFENNYNFGVLNVNEKTRDLNKDNVLQYVKLNPKNLDKKVFLIKTVTGRELKLTEDHPVMTKEGWKQAKNLKPNDFVYVFPHLEGTGISNNDSLIVSEKEFKEFLTKYEISRQNKKKIGEAKSFNELITIHKEKIKETVHGLNNLIIFNKGLTKREMDVFKIVASKKLISRIEVQKKLGLSRTRTVQLLKSLERKNFIKRRTNTDNKKVHIFECIRYNAIVLRNKSDIKKFVENRFNIKISYTTIKNIIDNKIFRSTIYRTIFDLKSKDLFPLRYNTSKIGIISRLTGFLLGDGHIVKTDTRLIFTGNKKTLEEIRKDIKELGYTPSKIESRKMEKEFKGKLISGTTTSFYVDSASLWLLFQYLGVPAGDKVKQSYDVPLWIRTGTKFVKREFLRSFFDAEMDTPICYGKNFAALKVTQHKISDLKESGINFMRQTAQILDEFDVKVSSISTRVENYSRKTGEKIISLHLTLAASNLNIFNFFRHVAFYYEKKKLLLSRHGQEYLREKIYVISKRQGLGKLLVSLVNSSNKTITEVARENNCSSDFIYDQIEGKEAHLPRDFSSLEDWRRNNALPSSELVLNGLESISQIDIDDVRDIMCENNHTFITNGIVSHNCNYSSKIIEPIQSRTAVFRFKSLTDADIMTYINLVADSEKLKITDEAKDAIIYLGEGDLRKVSNLLQSCASLGETITDAIVYDVSSQARPDDVKKMLSFALNGKFEDSRKVLHDLLLKQGLSGIDVIKEIHKQIYSLDGISEDKKVNLLEKTGEYEFRLSEGSNDLIQLEALLAQFLVSRK